MTNPKKNRKVFNIILAIVLAVGVWLYVINVENPTGTVPIRDIPVSLVGEDSLAERGLMVTDQSRDSVNLKLSGRRKTLMKLNRKNLTLELDVSTITSEGEHTISCRASFPNNIGTDNVSVSDWEDLRVTVTVEKQETKEIPVRGEFIGTEAENCLAGAVSTDPETITLTGPAEALDGVSYALATIGGKEVSDTITETASVVLMGPGSKPASRKNITLDQETVDVTVPVRQVVALPLTVTLTGGDTTSAADVTVDISPKNLTVVKEAGADLPQSISLGEIDLSNVLADTSYALPIHLPDGVVAWGQEVRFATVSLSFDKGPAAGDEADHLYQRPRRLEGQPGQRHPERLGPGRSGAGGAPERRPNSSHCRFEQGRYRGRASAGRRQSEPEGGGRREGQHPGQPLFRGLLFE